MKIKLIGSTTQLIVLYFKTCKVPFTVLASQRYSLLERPDGIGKHLKNEQECKRP